MNRIKDAVDSAKAILVRNGRYRRVFGTKEGEWVLNDLLKVAGVGRPEITSDMGEALARENRRFLALHIATILNMPDTEVIRRAQTTNYLGDDNE